MSRRRRRGSLVGPLLIILIGSWFLASSLRPDLPLLDLAARYWPFVLVGWGALRLMELLVWAVRGQPLPQSGISGGEWTAVVFVCLFGYGLFQFMHAPWEQLGVVRANRLEIFGHTYDYSVDEQKMEADKIKRVLLENLYGSARIVGAEAREVRVGGRKSIRALHEAEAEQAHKQSAVEFSTQADQLVIRTNQDRVTGNQRVRTELEIVVPRTVSIEIRGREGDLEVSNVAGPVEISSDNAGVRLESIGDRVRLDLRKSDIVRAVKVKGALELVGARARDVELEDIGGEVTLNGSFSGDLNLRAIAKSVKLQSPATELRIERVPGRVHMDLGEFVAANLVGPIRLSTNRSRDVQIEQFTDSLEVTLDRGDLTLRPMQLPVAKIETRTRSGNIDLTLPEAAKFQLKATTERGDLSNDFGSALQSDVTGSEDRHRKNAGGAITGSTGEGPWIVAHTDRGSITVRKDSGAPLAPAPPSPPKPKLPAEAQ